MAYSLDDLGKTLVNQLYEIVCGGDGCIPPAKDTFLTWCHPGMPFQANDFDFAAKGFGTGKDAEAEKELVNNAFAFAQLVDFVPTVTAAYTHDRQRGAFGRRPEGGAERSNTVGRRPQGGAERLNTVGRRPEGGAERSNPVEQTRLSTLYGEILRFSKVVHNGLTDEEQKKIENFRNLLRTTKKVKDIVTDEEKEITEAGPMLNAYSDKLAAYIAVALQYNNKRIAAQSATGVDGRQAVLDWTSNAELYRTQVKAALDAWISGGYRNEVDQIYAYIDQINRRDMVLWRQALVEMYDDAVVNADGQGKRFYNTTLVPADFASGRRWNRYFVSHEAVDSRTHLMQKSWRAGGGMSFGLLSVGGSAAGKSSQYNENYATESFTLSFELCQVLISRPWFYPEFFGNRSWTLRKGEGWTFDQMPSDGGDPPRGNFIGYPTAILFARNIRIESAEFSKAYSEYSREVGGQASVGWGPFSLGGGYSRADRTNHFHSEADSQGLSVPGMQIIGFVNRLLGKTPNPLPELKPERFV